MQISYQRDTTNPHQVMEYEKFVSENNLFLVAGELYSFFYSRVF